MHFICHSSYLAEAVADWNIELETQKQCGQSVVASVRSLRVLRLVISSHCTILAALHTNVSLSDLQISLSETDD